MKFEIKNRFTGNVQFTAEIEATEGSLLGVKIGLAVKWAVENKANLRSADLRSADLRYADLRYADLRSADLRSADLRYADLRYADLRYADLSSADLSSADLSYADLSSADLSDETFIPTGETWCDYVDQTVPALLTAGGKSVEEIVSSGAWDCHDWCNCPMHCAFNASGIGEVPILLRPRAEQFVQFFDASLIPCPDVKAAEAQEI